MAICSRCGCEFDVSTARRIMGARYGSGCYNDYYPEGDVCEDCADEEIGADNSTGADLKNLMGGSW